ncbi:MAG: hypothetical protein HGB37_01005 [Candidatus Moranbacteria bacterium]|jgi:hypothetical protein|nr:hypothetical protein [Candidatus Moranbacteria bacterium]NTW89476.1 hypothetical protein [Candidatus Moranbacteria bacterium]
MYWLANVERYLSVEGGGGKLELAVKEAILERARKAADDGGCIAGGNTEEIFDDAAISEDFDLALGTDIGQMQIFMEKRDAAG